MTLLEEAAKYAAYGWRILPIHSIDADGVCTCGKVECSAPGKHPRTFQGSKDASSDPEVVRRWWQQWPTANIGLACGRESGVFVVDIDPRHGGFESIDEWEENREEGPLPETLIARSGGGGKHLIFKWPQDGPVPGRNPWLPGIEIKAEGGYVVLPPSNHISGGKYQWANEAQPVDAPGDLLASIRTGSRTSKPALPPAKDILKGVPEGQRDDVLFRHACQLRRRGYEMEHAMVIILEAARNSTPPFAEAEARKKVEQAWKYGGDEDDLPIGASLESDSESRHLSDDGNAHRLVDQHGRDIRYVGAWGWLVWDGCRWLRDETGVATALARETVQTIYQEALEEEDKARRKAVNAWAFRSEAAARIEAMVRLARADRKIAVEPEVFDADPWQLNCPNGVLDLRTGDLRPHKRDDMLTKVTGVRYNPEAACPRWMSFLEKIMPDEEVREFLRRAVGYSLSGITREKIMIMLHGTGDNGKTVFLETVRAVMGDYAMGTPSATLVNRKADAIPNDVARLRGARFVTASETREGAQLASEFIKEITGGDKITARFMRAEWFEFTPEFKLWLATNHPPVITDFGDAIWRRMRLIPFTVAVPKAEQIPRDVLLEGFMQEAAGILNWAVAGCLAWQNDGLKEPTAVMLATETYRDDMDWFGEFIHECCVAEESAITPTMNLYDVFRRWSLMRGDTKPWSVGSFGRQLKQRGFAPGRTRTGEKGFHGIQLREALYSPNV